MTACAWTGLSGIRHTDSRLKMRLEQCNNHLFHKQTDLSIHLKQEWDLGKQTGMSV